MVRSKSGKGTEARDAAWMSEGRFPLQTDFECVCVCVGVTVWIYCSKYEKTCVMWRIRRVCAIVQYCKWRTEPGAGDMDVGR